MSGQYFKAVIFDMDGVLVNSEPHHVLVEKRLFEYLSLNISEQQHSSFVGKSSFEMWSEIIRNNNLTYKVEELVKKNKIEFINYLSDLKGIELMPGIVSILEKISGKKIPMAVASSSDAEMIEIILSRTGISKFFIHKVDGRSVEKSKPSPDIFLYAATLLSVKPEECIVVEDSTNGIKAAKAAGMFCIAYKGIYHRNQDLSLADASIENFSQMEEILDKHKFYC
jgi:beta-phosphoglucomutase